jgi:hypothetical protein
MPFEGIPLDSLTREHLERLCEDEVEEGPRIEYKLSFPSTSSEDKREFLGDVCAFANTRGGYIVYGVRDKKDEEGQNTGIPEAIEGVSTPNLDQTRLRLEQIVRTGISPRIRGMTFSPGIEVSPGRFAVVLHVPQSLSAPHMVTVNHSSRFYARGESGKYIMDIEQIRDAFLAYQAVTERFRDFRLDRLSRIRSGQTPMKLMSGARIVVHFVSLTSFRPATAIGVSAIAQIARTNDVTLAPLATRGWDSTFNFDGYLTYRGASQDRQTVRSYLQAFRNGCLEGVFVWPRDESGQRLWSGLFRPRWFREWLPKEMQRDVRLLTILGIEPPFVLAVSLLDVQGFVIESRSPTAHLEGIHPIREDSLLFEEILIETTDADPGKVLKPTFDALWQASGYPRAPEI